ncbi:MAG: alkaline phosphatase family protein [Deltaproteobacteria bacterium]|nr:alkaline phosphatase family protein [Deltaproteobacteria bacterium]
MNGLAFGVVGLLACGQPVSKPAPVDPPPRLVVLLIIDQLPQWAFAAKRHALTGGFDRLLREGEWHTGEHPSPATVTATGHALLGSGEPPSASGIISNEWWDRESEAMVGAVENPGAAPSAHRLRVPGLGDAMALGAGGKAVGVSLKDRAAILPLGRAGTAIWYDNKKVAFTGRQLSGDQVERPWLIEHNRAHPISARLRDVWTPLDPARLATLSGVVDAQPGEVGEEHFGPTFPHDLGANPHPAAALIAMPLGNDLVLDLATAALDGEQLGADPIPDLLVVSLSANDYIGHGWGQESWEAWDELLRLDQRLAKFLDALDAKAGTGRWAMIVTSDHGAAPMPETFPDGGRLSYESIKQAANNAAIAELGPGEWIASAKFAGGLYLTKAALAQPDRERNIALRKIVYALRSFPGLERVERTADFAGNCGARTGDAFLLCQMLDPERSGEVIFLPKRGWILQSKPHATAHGSANAYDREVPVIMLPPKRMPHAPLAKPSATTVRMIRISTILARWLGITPPVSLKR